jgi:hypothetical protein
VIQRRRAQDARRIGASEIRTERNREASVRVLDRVQ